jgi:hypothetical protein
LQDLLLLLPERAASTFREDAMRDIRQRLGDKAIIEEGEPVHPNLADNPPDVVIRAGDRAPVAVFFGQTDQRVLEAILLQMQARLEFGVPCSVIALLERGQSISQKNRQRADNRLTTVPVYRGDENAAITRIEQEVLGWEPTVH